MAYDVVVIKQVHSCAASASSNDAWLEKRITLPFVPFVGLSVSLGPWPAWTWATQITEVYYDIDVELFRCYTEPDKTLYNAAVHRWPANETPSLEKIVQEWEEVGWERRP